jgi:hypothetical protein
LDERWLSVVRLARDLGDISSLYPHGIERAYDLPYTVHNAIMAALGFLSFEELPEKERPPKRIWLNSDAMEEWWADVKAMRKAEMEGKGGDESSGPMMKNALRDRLLIGFDK